MAILLVAPAALTVPQLPVLIMEPGPAPDIAEKSEIHAVTFESAGSFHLTTVQIKRPSGSTVLEVVRGVLAPERVLVSRSSIYPDGDDRQRADQVQSAQMVQSEVSAAAAAFSVLGIDYQLDGALVVDVDPDSPAAALLHPGDLITAVDAVPVEAIDDLIDWVGERLVGETVALTVRRDDQTVDHKVQTIESEAEPGRAVIGIEVSQHHRAPIDIDFDAADIGGPSAGLMFALSIYDRLTEDDLTGGRKVAGTGTIDNSEESLGVVGGVGAVELKVRGARKIGAQVFLAPAEAVERARRVAGPSMQVIGVSTLSDAIEELEALKGSG